MGKKKKNSKNVKLVEKKDNEISSSSESLSNDAVNQDTENTSKNSIISITDDIANTNNEINISEQEEGENSQVVTTVETKIENTSMGSQPQIIEGNFNNSETTENEGVEEISDEKKYKMVEESNSLPNKRSHKFVIGVCIALAIILILFLLFSTVFALVVQHSSTVINGVSIKDIDISGLTREQALEKLSGSFNKKLSQKINLVHNEYELAVFPKQFEVSFDLEKTVDMAYNTGRSRKYFSK